jgi:hypothetical protein
MKWAPFHSLESGREYEKVLEGSRNSRLKKNRKI